MFLKVISAPLQFEENQDINKRPPEFLDSQKLKLISPPPKLVHGGVTKAHFPEFGENHLLSKFS